MSESDGEYFSVKRYKCNNETDRKINEMLRELDFDKVVTPILRHLLEPNIEHKIERCDLCKSDKNGVCKKGKFLTCFSCKKSMCFRHCYNEDKKEVLCFRCMPDVSINFLGEERKEGYYCSEKCSLCDDFQVTGYEHDSFVCDRCEKVDCVIKEYWCNPWGREKFKNAEDMRVCSDCYEHLNKILKSEPDSDPE